MTDLPLATVGALAVGPKQQVLLIRTHKWLGSWGVPGGKIHYGESLRHALLREFREETGLELFDIHWGPVQEAVLSREFHKPAHFILLNFVARSASEKVVLNQEAQEYRWLPPREALTLPLNTPTRRLLHYYLEHGFSTSKLGG